MAEGTVKWINADKGFGFPDDGTGDVFVHRFAIQADGYRRLQESRRVGFTVGQGAIGPQPKARPRAPINPVRLLQAGCAHDTDRRLASSAHGAGSDRSMDAIAVSAKAPE